MRAAAALCVVAVHAVGAVRLHGMPPGLAPILAGSVESLLHYTREAFMVVTGLVVFHRRDQPLFQAGPFWARRIRFRVLPYVLWSLLYALVSLGPPTGPRWAARVLYDLGLGDASYQLYYMSVIIQFYLCSPLLWALFRRFHRHHGVILASAFLYQILWDTYLAPLALYPVRSGWRWGAAHQGHFLAAYVFFFVLGAWAGLHLREVTAFLRRRALWVGGLSVGAFLLMEGHYFLSAVILKIPVQAASAVLQPVMVPYSVAAVALLWMAGTRLFDHRPGAGRRLGQKIVVSVSEASFGIFLVHVMLLRTAFLRLTPGLIPSPAWRMAALWGATFAGSYLVARALMAVPGLSLVVGHAGPVPSPSLSGPFGAWRNSLRGPAGATPGGGPVRGQEAAGGSSRSPTGAAPRPSGRRPRAPSPPGVPRGRIGRRWERGARSP